MLKWITPLTAVIALGCGAATAAEKYHHQTYMQGDLRAQRPA